ncbi:MAG: cytochrome c peroxidase [Chitinophagales bacterium]
MVKNRQLFFVMAAIGVAVMALNSCKEKNIEEVKYDFEHNYADLNQAQLIGKKIFFDTRLSNPAGLSCAGCHAPQNGFSDVGNRPFSEGAVTGSFINRNASSLAYLSFVPARFYNSDDSTYVGGLFMDGRVNSFEEQAIKPLLNHLEMNAGSGAEIVEKIKNSDYASLFKRTYGATIFEDTTAALQAALQSLAAFERSEQLSPFSSKYDLYLAGEVNLTEQEMRGLKLFNDTAKAKCANCHPSTEDEDAGVVLFTDFTYDNIGLPPNPNSPVAGPDLGLGAVVGSAAENGKFRVPTLRNVEVSAPYFHNGVFNTLEDAVRFYSERDIPGKYPAPEVGQNVNMDELGNLQLTQQDIDDIVAFLKTLTDGYQR